MIEKLTMVFSLFFIVLLGINLSITNDQTDSISKALARVTTLEQRVNELEGEHQIVVQDLKNFEEIASEAYERHDRDIELLKFAVGPRRLAR